MGTTKHCRNGSLIERRLARYAWSSLDRRPCRARWSSASWIVGLSVLAAILESLRVMLIDLVAELHAGLPAEVATPLENLAEQPVDVAVYVTRNRAIINQFMTGVSVTAVVGGTALPTAEAVPGSRSRNVLSWVGGLAGLIAAGASVVALFVHP